MAATKKKTPRPKATGARPANDEKAKTTAKAGTAKAGTAKARAAKAGTAKAGAAKAGAAKAGAAKAGAAKAGAAKAGAAKAGAAKARIGKTGTAKAGAAKAGAAKARIGKTGAENAPALPETYAALRAILAPYARSMRVGKDDATWLEVLAPEDRDGKPVWFGAVRLGKAYVSYYLMPLYVTPEIAKGISPALAKHRQGKSCFNFKSSDPALFSELATLTEAGLAAFRARGLA